jgi:hypothetical protein
MVVVATSAPSPELCVPEVRSRLLPTDEEPVWYPKVVFTSSAVPVHDAVVRQDDMPVSL